MTEQARSFDRAAVEYERGRPGWPSAILDSLPLPAEATVLDLGAGTGKLTRVLAERYARVVAVEPLDGLRAILSEVVPAAEVHDAVAEELPLADGEVDGVFCAQSFHWFANDTALEEIARVLRPGGVLALLWNRDLDPSPLPESYSRRFGALRDELCPAPIDEDILAHHPFGPEHEGHGDHEQVSTREQVNAFAASMSWIASRDDRDEVLAELAALLPEGEYVFPLRAHLTWVERL